MRFATTSFGSRLSLQVARFPFFSTTSEAILKQVKSGVLLHDAAQELAARRFSALQLALRNYDNAPLVDYFTRQRQRNTINLSSSDGSIKIESNISDKNDERSAKNEMPLPPTLKIPRGLYLHGDVGTGKSMLMDMFFSHVPIAKKRRVHFHAFLQEVHERIHALKKRDLNVRGRDFHIDVSEDNNPIVRVAKEVASEVSLLCFDEFQVTDVADALILKQLFSTLFKLGTVMVATSNRPPTALYEGGLNRSYFLPFIELLEHHCFIHELKSNLDYRKLLSKDVETFFIIGTEANGISTDEVFERLLNGRSETSIELSVSFQRNFIVKRAHPERLVARFTFSELCQRDIGAADYRSIAKTFPVVLLEDIPQLNLTQHNEARRFITLVDELYEQKCAVMCSCHFPLEEMFLDSPETSKPSLPKELLLREVLGIDVAQSCGKPVASLASVRELSFAFQRASSRLHEMCSAKWWDMTLASKV